MGRTLATASLALCIALIAANPVAASGDGFPVPWYLDPFGGEAKDQAAFSQGRVGVIMARAPRSRLFMAWRVLHGMKVGPAAGALLSVPCCDGPRRDYRVPAPPTAHDLWLDARKAVTPTPDLFNKDLPTDRNGPNFTTVGNCFDDAFLKARDVLHDRVQRYGAASPDVRVWLSSQDTVFRACSNPSVTLPSLSPSAPAWLRADRAYQQAALDFYSGRLLTAAAEFRAIADDQTSPWRIWGLYLQARALLHQALDNPSPAADAAAKMAFEDLARAPNGAEGKTDGRDLSHILAFRYEPAKLATELDGELLEATLPNDANILFRDYSDLIDQGSAQTDLADWLTTIVARPKDKRVDDYQTPDAVKLTLYHEARADALDHARSRWRETRDRAWLLAALTLADPQTAVAKALVADGEKIKPSYPGWLTIQYHVLRLRLPTGDVSALRSRLDALLARQGLSTSDRNIFSALRLQVAADPADFAHWALRRRICQQMTGYVETGCVRDNWEDVVQRRGIFDQNLRQGTTGLGEDARAIIDRMPLADRIALSRDPVLPDKIRMDIALTSFARALQLQDDASLDALATELAPLLPQMAEDWRRIPAAKPGPDKRFAVDMVMAKIPGLRVDLVDYERPSGRVVDFQSHWMDWLILPVGHRKGDIRPPALTYYQVDGYFAFYPWGHVGPDSDPRTDLSCLGECGRGAQPLRLPDFVQRGQNRAKAERAFFVQRDDTENGVYDEVAHKLREPPSGPASARAVWDEMLDYAKVHPNDPRIPEALHWIVHASHFGASHNHSGRRAFQMLHQRYPQSIWAKQTKVYSE